MTDMLMPVGLFERLTKTMHECVENLQAPPILGHVKIDSETLRAVLILLELHPDEAIRTFYSAEFRKLWENKDRVEKQQKKRGRKQKLPPPDPDGDILWRCDYDELPPEKQRFLDSMYQIYLDWLIMNDPSFANPVEDHPVTSNEDAK